MTNITAAVVRLDQLVRLHQAGFVAVWPLLGLACVSAWSPTAVVAILLVALSFNAFGVLIDDAVHVEVDRRDPLRAHRAVVRGVVTPTQAVCIALLQIPLALTIHVAAGFSVGALVWLLAAFLGQAVYDLFGKSCPVPPLMEVAEAGAALSLVAYGAASIGGEFNALVWATAGAGAAFILLVNSFHGSLRDIEVELEHRQRTTPIWLGCQGVRHRTVHISSAMSLYAALWQAALIALSIYLAAKISDGDQPSAAIVAVYAAAFINAALLIGLHLTPKPTWDLLMRIHVAFLMLPVMLAFAPRLGIAGSALLFLVYVAPALLTVLWWYQRVGAPATLPSTFAQKAL